MDSNLLLWQPHDLIRAYLENGVQIRYFTTIATAPTQQHASKPSVYTAFFFFSLQNTNTPLWQSWRQRWLFVWNWNAETGVILPRHWFPRTLDARWMSFVLWPLAWFDFLFAFSFITWVKYIHTPTGRSHTTGAGRSSCSQSFILGLQTVHNICGQVRNRLVLSPLHNIT